MSSSRLAVDYTIKPNPTLSLTSATCALDLLTYNIVFTSDGTVTSTAGTVDNTAKTVTGITAGTNVTLTATLDGCTTDLLVTAPDCNCPPLATPTNGVPAEICFGDPATAISATVNTGETIDWYENATGGTALASENLSYTSTETAAAVYTYYAEARNTTTNCVSSSRLAVDYTILTTPAITNIVEVDPTICGGQGSLNFTFTGVPNGIYSINYGAGSFSGVTVSGSKASVAAIAGTYNNLTITVNTCTSATGINANITDPNPPPAPTITVQDNCGESVLTASNYTGTLLWSTGESNESITVTTAGVYSLTQTVDGCTSDAASATAAPQGSNLKPEIEVTNDCGESTITLNNLEDNAWFVWQFNNTTDSTLQNSITISESGEYTIYQKLQNCTSMDTTVFVNVQSVPSPPTGNDQIICATESVTTLTAEAISTEPNTIVVWFDEESGGNNILSPVLDAIGTITYYAESQDTTTGCVSTSRTSVTLTLQSHPDLILIDTTIIGKPHSNVAVLIFPAESFQYQWYLNSDPILNATNQYYYVFESDRITGNIFSVEVEFQNGCKSKFDYHYLRNSTDNSVNAFNNTNVLNDKSIFIYYPNPVSHTLNIAVDYSKISGDEPLTARIYSVNGSVVLETPLNKNPQNIEMSHLQPGVYSVAVFSGQKRLDVETLIMSKHGN